MIGGLEEARREGTPQGGPLSPLLSKEPKGWRESEVVNYWMA